MMQKSWDFFFFDEKHNQSQSTLQLKFDKNVIHQMFISPELRMKFFFVNLKKKPDRSRLTGGLVNLK